MVLTRQELFSVFLRFLAVEGVLSVVEGVFLNNYLSPLLELSATCTKKRVRVT